MKLRGVNYCLLIALLLVLPGLSPINAEACRLLPIPPGSENVFWVHVEGPCLPGEEEALAVKGADLFGALLQGKRIDLDHVLVVDPIMLDLLPQQTLSEYPAIPPAVRQRLQEQGVTAVRVIPEAVSIRHSRFEKVLATNLVEGALLVLGPVDFTGTVFQQSIDLSKTVFVGPVTFLNARVDFEGFFIGSQFTQGADFSYVTFGTHSRFHQARFWDRVTFADAHFTGVAEFLEVEFQQTADFSRSVFASGTGFSGSVFRGPADFSAIAAAQEIYFRFTEFRESVTFVNAQIHSVVDFTNARFDGAQDFAGVEFRTLPELSGSNLPLNVASVQNVRSLSSQVGIFLGLVILVLCYLWFTKEKKSA
ncbi:pentapeptide repeat-containing protein [Nitrospira sp. MA-1]|nr:pentapeptide repeat-containing protein [Nitrospira sp. MA-1]